MVKRILKNRKGFTLIELIVVLGVLAIIMAISVPKYLGIQQQAKVDADIATLGQIAKITELFYIQGKISKDDYKNVSGTTISDELQNDLNEYITNVKFQSTLSPLSEVKLYINNGVATVVLGDLKFPNTKVE